MTQPTMHMALEVTSVINSTPNVKFAFDGSFSQYLSAWPKASFWDKKKEFSIRRWAPVYTFGVTLGMPEPRGWMMLVY